MGAQSPGRLPDSAAAPAGARDAAAVLERASSVKSATAGLLAVGLAVRIALSLRPVRFLDGLTIPDDTYLALTIARNLGRGLGPLYGSGYTNGFQPLYVFLMAPVYALFPASLEGAVHFALVLLSVCDTLMAATLARLAERITGRDRAALFIVAAWCLNAFVIRIALGGLETSLSAFLAVLALLQLHRARTSLATGPVFRLGLLVGLAVLARVDNVFLGIVAAGFVAFPAAAGLHGRAVTALRRTSTLAAGIALPVLPWLVYSYRYTGDVYPVSGKAVRFMSTAVNPLSRDFVAWHLFTLAAAARTIVQSHTLLLGLVVLFGLVALAVDRRGAAALVHGAAPAWAYGLLVALAYPLHVYAIWFFPRYLFPVTIPLLLTLGLLGDLVLCRLRAIRSRRFVMFGLAATLIVTWGARSELFELVFSRDTTSRGYMNLGLWAERSFPAGTAIGGSQTGALSYFATSLRVVNLDGVVNRACFESLLQRKNIDYILDSGIEYVVGWPVNIRFIEVCSDHPIEPYLRPLGVVPGFRSWGNEWHLYRVRRGAPEPPHPDAR